MGGNRAKQFLELAGTPIIVHTVQAFERCEVIQEIVIVLPAEDAAGFLALTGPHNLQKVSQVVPGGATRAESVWRGFQAIHPASAEIVAIHDGVRPFVTTDEIARTVAAAREHGAAILVAPLIDTIKEVNAGGVVRTLGRTQLRRALTPQCFRYALLRRAYEQAELLDPDFTDESVLIERLGLTVATVDGSARNIKITRPEDLVIGELLLRSSQ